MTSDTSPLNKDPKTVAAFTNQWSRFEDLKRDPKEVRALFDRFFEIFPWDMLPKDAKGFEMGCGSGRFANFVAPEVGHLTCVDAAPDAIRVAKKKLSAHDNITFLNESVGHVSIPENSMDFGYSYGVLHHVPDTPRAIQDCTKLLKPGAPFLIYLYYGFDNRPFWFKVIWWLSNFIRIAICNMPMPMRNFFSDIMAFVLYWPLARLAKLFSKFGFNVSNFPLSDFKDATIARMRSNSRDRFGTPLEQRFTRKQIERMLNNAGIQDVKFSDGSPYWCAVGIKS